MNRERLFGICVSAIGMGMLIHYTGWGVGAAVLLLLWGNGIEAGMRFVEHNDALERFENALRDRD